MRIFSFPVQDASIYSEFQNQNTGLDEILDIGKMNDGQFIARSLVKFNIPSVPIGAKFDLILYYADAEMLSANQEVDVCLLSQSWTEGTGYFFQVPISANDGVTWTQSSSGSSWPTGSAGGSFLQSGTLPSFLTNPITDLTIEVTSLVAQWISSSVPNNGFLIKFPNTDENNFINQGILKAFSNQTHTIYRPTLVARWDDSTYVTGTISWPTSSMDVVPVFHDEYRVGEMARVDVICKEKYPLKVFQNSRQTFATTSYLPSSSYYSIVDEQSGNIIIPFSSESKISSGNDQNYFVFNIGNMYPRRFYRILLKVDHDGLSEIFDPNAIFTVK